MKTSCRIEPTKRWSLRGRWPPAVVCYQSTMAALRTTWAAATTTKTKTSGPISENKIGLVFDVNNGR